MRSAEHALALVVAVWGFACVPPATLADDAPACNPAACTCVSGGCAPELVGTLAGVDAPRIALIDSGVFACGLGPQSRYVVLARDGKAPPRVVHDDARCAHVAGDGATRDVYVATADSSGNRTTLARVDTNSGAVVPLASLHALAGLALGPAHVFWSGLDDPPMGTISSPPPPARHGLYRLARAEGASYEFVTSTRGASPPGALAMANDGTVVLSFPESNELLAVSSGGATPTPLLDGLSEKGAGPTSVAAAGGLAYFGYRSGLWRAPLAGRAPAAPVPAAGAPDAITAGEAWVAWLEGASLRWMPREGAPRTLVDGLAGAADLCSDGIHLYWVERVGGAVRRVRMPGR